jgi:hypothetical protein
MRLISLALLLLATDLSSSPGPVSSLKDCGPENHIFIFADGTIKTGTRWEYDPVTKATYVYGPAEGQIFCDGFE